MRHQDDYVVCIVGGRQSVKKIPASFGRNDRRVARSGGVAIRAGDPSAFILVEMYTSVPCTLDAPTNVTLLSDAS